MKEADSILLCEHCLQTQNEKIRRFLKMSKHQEDGIPTIAWAYI